MKTDKVMAFLNNKYFLRLVALDFYQLLLYSFWWVWPILRIFTARPEEFLLVGMGSETRRNSLGLMVSIIIYNSH